MTDFKLDAFLPYQVSVLARRLSQGFAEIYEARYGLSIAEWRVLAHLHDTGTCSVREIHKQADLEKSRVSRSVSRLEERGLVGRAAHSEDKRLIRLTLTPEGHKMMEELLPLALAYERRVLAEIEGAEDLRAAIDRFLGATKPG